ncbi:MAG: HlyD family efflux transporter periplasmic adaptor subunit, partial [Bacteroidota bacterium]
MKNFTGFKYQKSVLRTIEEPPKKKKFNWDRFFFIIALVVIVIYFINRLYGNVMFVSVNGEVVMNKVAVHFTEDIRLEQLYVEEGDPVDAGDTLFSYRYEDYEQMGQGINNISIRNKIGRSSDWLIREKLNVKRQIAMKKSEKEGIETIISIKQRELDDQKKQILLGVDVAHKLPPLVSDIAEMEGDIDVIDQEIKVLRKHLYALRKQEKIELEKDEEDYQDQVAAGDEIYNSSYYYVAPINGLIGRIFISPNEICYETQSVMAIHQLENLKVKAYFDQESYDRIKIGDEVTVEFPDGKTGLGVINNFYVSTYPMPPEFQKKYEPVTRSIVADVIPISKNEAAR